MIVERFSSKIRNKERCPLLFLLFINYQKSQLEQLGKKKKIKGIRIGNEVKLSLCANDMILYMKMSKDQKTVASNQ